VGVGSGEKNFVKPLPNVFTGNTVVLPNQPAVDLRTSAYVGTDRPDGMIPIDPKDVFDNNTYTEPFKASLFAGGKEGKYDLAGWQKATAAAGKAFDEHAKVVPPPTAPFVAVMANEYEPGRGHVVIFNWSMGPAVTVDLSPILAKGAKFQVHKAKESFVKPVLEGTYDKPVAIPMVGDEFEAFLVRTVPAGIAAKQPACLESREGMWMLRAADEDSASCLSAGQRDSPRNPYGDVASAGESAGREVTAAASRASAASVGFCIDRPSVLTTRKWSDPSVGITRLSRVESAGLWKM